MKWYSSSKWLCWSVGSIIFILYFNRKHAFEKLKNITDKKHFCFYLLIITWFLNHCDFSSQNQVTYLFSKCLLMEWLQWFEFKSKNNTRVWYLKNKTLTNLFWVPGLRFGEPEWNLNNFYKNETYQALLHELLEWNDATIGFFIISLRVKFRSATFKFMQRKKISKQKLNW